MTEPRERILMDAITRWGAHAQIIKAIEEMGELIQCLAKDLNENHIPASSSIYDKTVEEIADVQIMSCG